MKIKCKIDGHICELPDSMVKFYIHPTLIYSCTLSRKLKPHIHPVIFVNEKDTCTIVFIVNKQSTTVQNLIHNPKISLAIDITHPINPFWNRGISIKGTSQLVETKELVNSCVSDLQEKYGSSTVTKIVGIDTIQNFVKVSVCPIKIIYWKGPYFKRFSCTSRQ